jgi:hypothetical protein
MSTSPSSVVHGRHVKQWVKKLGHSARGLVNTPILGQCADAVGGMITTLEVSLVRFTCAFGYMLMSLRVLR